MRKWTLLTLVVVLLAMLAGCVNDTPTTATTNAPTTAPTTAPTEPTPTAKETYTVTFNNYDGTTVYTTEVEKGASVDMSKVPEAEHTYRKWYTFTGWDKTAEHVTEDIVITAQYSYNAISDEAFEFVLLEDDTYGIRLADKFADYSYLNLEGYVGFPEEYNGKPVTRILKEGMIALKTTSLFAQVENVLVPSSYKIIENRAFSLDITALTVAEGVEEIWAGAFQGLGDANYMDELVPTVYLPASLNFLEPTALRTDADIVLTNGDVFTYNSVSKEIYTDDGHTLVWKNMTGIVNLTLDAKINALWPGLFYENWELQSVTFKGDVKELPAGLFSSCGMLMELNIQPCLEKIWGPEQIPELRKNMHSDDPLDILTMGNFSGCNMLSFELPEALTHLGDFTFFTNTVSNTEIHFSEQMEYIGLCVYGYPMEGGLSKITVDPNNPRYYSVNDCCLIERGTGINGGDRFMMFAVTNEISDLVIPSGVTSIDPFAFFGAKNLKSLTVPEGVEKLPARFLDSTSYLYDDNWNYLGMGGLEKLVLPSTLKHLEAGFDGYGVDSNGNIVFGGIMMFGDYPTINAQNLRELVFPNGNNIEIYEDRCMYLSEYVFPLTIPASAKEIGSLAIQGTNQQFLVAEGNTKFVAIDGALFERLGGNKLKLIIFTKDPGVTKFDMSNLGDYILTEIGANAVGGCVNLTEIIIPDTVEIIAKEAFYGVSGATKIVIGSGVKEIGQMAFFGCSSLQELVFRGDKLPAIGREAFLVMDYMTGGYALPENLLITVPTDKYFEYFYSFYSAAQTDLADRMTTEGITKYNYAFDANGGSEVEGIMDSIFANMPPYTEKEGYNLLGWYTKDGANGDWGERVNFYTPYRSEGDITLHARWSETERFEDGSYYEFAYQMTVGEKCTMTLADTGMGNWLFRFTATETGLYDFPLDPNVFPNYSVRAYELVDGKLREVKEIYTVQDPVSMKIGFYVEAGQTIYLSAKISGEVYGNDTVTDIFVPYDFEVRYLGEYTGDKWWEFM